MLFAEKHIQDALKHFESPEQEPANKAIDGNKK